MFEHILIPLDGSEHSASAMPLAKEIATQTTKITLLHILELPLTPFLISPSPPALPQETEDYTVSRNRQIEQAKAYLQTVQANHQLDTLNFDMKIVIGHNPADKILDFAAEEAVNIIVMATRGQSGITRWIMGSVTQKVLQATTCPVLVVPSS